MKFLMKYVEEKNGKIYIHLYIPNHLHCRAHKAIQTFKSSMFEIMGFDDSYTHEMKPTYYVVHGYGENGDWIDWELGVTTELRDYVIRNAANAALLNAEGISEDRMRYVVKKLVKRHESSLKKNPPLRMGIIGLKSFPGIFVVFDINKNANYPVVDVISTKPDTETSLDSFESFFGKIAKRLGEKNCSVKCINNSSEAIVFATMSPSVYSCFSQGFFDDDDDDFRRICEITEEFEKIKAEKHKTLRRLAIASNYI